MRYFFFFSIILTFSWSCTPKMSTEQTVAMATSAPTTTRYVKAEDCERLPQPYEATLRQNRHCREALDYAPDTNYLDHTPIRYIRVNFHWMNTKDRKANFDGKKAVDFIHGLVKASNYHLRKNKKMWLPKGNNTPVLPTQFRIVLTPRPDDPEDDGIYFHYDDEKAYYVHKGRNANLMRKDLIVEYGVQLDTVLNIFMHPHHPDSVVSKTYLAGTVGVALGNTIKLAGMVENGGTFWNYAPTLNHELGHILGLPHAWRYDDGCDDTPRHPGRCWAQSEPGCADKTSNNVMDYSNAQKAWTPCQIGRVHMRLTQNTSRVRKFLEPRWCSLNEEAHIYIQDTVAWDCRKDLHGHLTIEPGGYLTMYCLTSLPKDARITVRAGGTLLLDGAHLWNSCGKQWDGIILEDAGDTKGQILVKGDVKIENAVHSPELGEIDAQSN
jgi:hypothetical protein